MVKDKIFGKGKFELRVKQRKSDRRLSWYVQMIWGPIYKES